MIIVTKEFLDSGKSINGSWNAKQLRCLGLRGFEHKWIKRVIGKEVTTDAAKNFLDLKDYHIYRKQGIISPAIQEKKRKQETPTIKENMPWNEQYSTIYWQKRKAQTLEYYRYHCMVCGDEKSMLHVHHNRYRTKYVWDAPFQDLIVLCQECHNLFHREKKLKKLMTKELDRLEKEKS